MKKWSQYQEGRNDGLNLALSIVKKSGIEGLEQEVKFRGATGINIGLCKQDLNTATNAIKQRTLDTFTILGIACLHDEFGFGQKRCQRWLDKMDEGAQYLLEDLATWDDYIASIKEQLGMDLTIRWK